MKQAHSNGLDTLLLQATGDLPNLTLVKRELDLAIGAQTLSHLKTMAPRDQRRRLVVLQVVHDGDTKTPHFQNVSETLGCDQCGFCTLVLQNGVGGHGRRVHHGFDLARVNAKTIANFVDCRQDRAAVVIWGGRHLQGTYRPVTPEHNVCESSADVAGKDVLVHACMLAVDHS